MTAFSDRPVLAGCSLEPGTARLVMDVEFALDDVVADLIRDELAGGGVVHVLLLLPRLGWSTDAAPIALRGRRIAQAREQRIEDLFRIAGDKAAQVTISVQRHRWRRATAGQNLSAYNPHLHAYEGNDR